MPSVNYSFEVVEDKLLMNKKKYDSLGKRVSIDNYYFKQDSIFDREDSIYYSGWFKEK